MKKIGIVGGVAWLSTVDYYSEICRKSELWHLDNQMPGAPSIPEISIESLNLNKAVAYLGVEGDEESWARFDEYHRTALRRVERSGVDFAVIASNSPHHRFDSIVSGIGIPVIGIHEVMAKQAARMGAGEVLLLGTALTMRSQKFREMFARYGIRASGPADEAARAATAELIEDLQLGRVQGAAERLSQIVRNLPDAPNRAKPVVCLACTELPLAFSESKTYATFQHDGVTYINSMAAHIQAAFEFALST